MNKQVNLLPKEITEEEENRARFRAWLIAVFGTVGFVLLFLLMIEERIYEAKDEIFRNSKEKEMLQEMISKMDLLKEKKEKLSLKQEILSKIIDDIPWQQTFFKISNSINQDTWLEQMDVTAGDETENKEKAEAAAEIIKASGGYFTSANKANEQKKNEGLKISIYGYAVTNIDLAEFMASLSTGNKFKSVNLEYAERTKLQEFEAMKFLIKCGI